MDGIKNTPPRARRTRRMEFDESSNRLMVVLLMRWGLGPRAEVEVEAVLCNELKLNDGGKRSVL